MFVTIFIIISLLIGLIVGIIVGIVAAILVAGESLKSHVEKQKNTILSGRAVTS